MFDIMPIYNQDQLKKLNQWISKYKIDNLKYACIPLMENKYPFLPFLDHLIFWNSTIMYYDNIYWLKLIYVNNYKLENDIIGKQSFLHPLHHSSKSRCFDINFFKKFC